MDERSVNPFAHIADVLTRIPAPPVAPRPRVVPIAAPRSWADPLPYTGCRLCDFGRDLVAPAGDLCHHPEVCSRPLPVDAARVKGGACGPDAKWLTVNGELL